MYLYLGQETVIDTESIIGIFDLDNTTVSAVTRDFLNRAQKEDKIVDVTQNLPKSFVLCNDAGKTTIYLTQMAPATLRKRAKTK